jgi:hypothetical protein
MLQIFILIIIIDEQLLVYIHRVLYGRIVEYINWGIYTSTVFSVTIEVIYGLEEKCNPFIIL